MDYPLPGIGTLHAEDPWNVSVSTDDYFMKWKKIRKAILGADVPKWVKQVIKGEYDFGDEGGDRELDGFEYWGSPGRSMDPQDHEYPELTIWDEGEFVGRMR